MKPFAILQILLFLAMPIFSQKSLIDERNGFKSIKLGTSKNTFDNLKFAYEGGETTAYNYYPTDNDLYNVFEKKYDAIMLYFDKSNTLVMIMITKVFTGSNFYQNALNFSKNTRDSFSKVFGSHDKVDSHSNSNSDNLSVFWYGQKNYYSVGTLYFGSERGQAESVVTIGRTKKLTSGF